MHGVWKARPKEMGETRVRGERAVIEADKVANWVRGTTEVSFDFRCLEGIRKVQASAAGALPMSQDLAPKIWSHPGRLRWPTAVAVPWIEPDRGRLSGSSGFH